MGLNLSASIVIYKNDETILEAIKSVINNRLFVLLYLIDNSPSDDVKVHLGEFLNNEKIIYIFNNNNVGFGAGHNIALRKCLDKSDYHLVLNPDVTFGPDVLSKLVDYMEDNKEVGMVMPKILYPNNVLQPVAKLLPTPVDLIGRRFLPKSWFINHNKRFQLEMSGYDKVFQAPFLCGCFMLIKVAALREVGIFDERYFMYTEDIDLTRRIYKKYKTIFYPHTFIYHEHAKASYKSFKMLYIHIKSTISYFNKWGWFNDKDRVSINKQTLSQF